MKQIALFLMYVNFSFAILDVISAFVAHKPEMFIWAAISAFTGALMESAIKARYP